MTYRCPKCASDMTQLYRANGEKELSCALCGLDLYVRGGETVDEAYERQIVRRERANDE
ncbi:MAG: hypothetical protein ACR2KS_10275 [Candidatus Eremiobacter antarcticus]|nr:hypothetical protein [Candidatus Eremiobacteraeota bacterium]